MSNLSPPSTAPANSSPSRTQQLGDSLSNLLAKSAQAIKSAELSEYALWCGLSLISVLIASIVVDHWIWQLNRPARYAVWGLSLAIIAWWLLFRILPVAFRRINPAYAAKKIEATVPDLKNSLMNWLQLSQDDNAVPRGILAAVGRYAVGKLKNEDASSLVDFGLAIRLGALLFGLLLALSVYLLLAPKSGLDTLLRVMAPWSNIAAPSRSRIVSVSPGHASVTLGSKLLIKAQVRGVQESEGVKIQYETVDGTLVDQVVPMESEIVGLSYLLEFGANTQGIQQPMRYRVLAGDAVAGPFDISVQAVPLVVIDRVEYSYPEYTRMEPRIVQGDGQIEAIEGTTVTLHATTNQPMQKARIEFDPILVDGQFRGASLVRDLTTSEKNLSGNWTLKLDEKRSNPTLSQYRIRATNRIGESNAEPVLYGIRILADLAPEVRIENEYRDPWKIGQQETVNLDIRAVDPDFGLRQLRLKLEKSGVAILDTNLLEDPNGILGTISQSYPFCPADHSLKVGDKVTLTLEAKDNRVEPDSSNWSPNITTSIPIHFVIGDPAPKNPPQEKWSNPTKPDEPPKKNDKSQGSNRNKKDRTQGNSDPAKTQENQNSPPQKPSSDNHSDSDESQEDSQQPGMASSQTSKNSQKSEQQPDSGSEGSESDSQEPSDNHSPSGSESSDSDSSDRDDSSSPPKHPGEIFEQLEKIRQAMERQEQNNNPNNKQSGDKQSGDNQSGDNQSGDKQSGDKQSGDKQSGDKQSGDKQSGDKQSGDKQSGDKQSGDKQSGDKQSGDKQSGDKQSGDKQSGDKQSGDKQSGDKQSGDKQSGDKQSGDKQSGDKQSGDKQSGDKQSGDKQSGDKQSGDKQSGDKQSGDKQSGDKQSGDKQSGDKQSGDKQSGDKQSGDKQSGDKQSGDKQSGDKQSGDKQSGDKQSGDKQSGDKQSGDKQSGDKQSGDKQSGDKQSGDKQSGDKQSGDKQSGDKQSGDKQSGDKQSGDKQSGDKQSGDKQSGDKQSGDKQSGDKQSGDKQSGDKQSGDKQSGDKQSGDKQSGDKQSGDKQSGDKQSGDKQSGDKQSGDKQSGDKQSGDKQSGDKQSGDKQSGEKQTGDKQSDNPSQGDGDSSPSSGSSSQSSNSKAKPQGTPGSSSSPANNDASSNIDDEANLEYARKATDLSLDFLRRQRDQPDPELLKKMGWTKQELEAFLKQWEKAKADAERDPNKKRLLDDALRSLGLVPPSSRVRELQENQDNLKGMRESGTKYRPPESLRQKYDSFRKAQQRDRKSP